MTNPETDRTAVLPDLDGDRLEFTWDLVFTGPDNWPHAIVRLGDREILRERTWYENADHYRSVIKSLIAKYPGRVYDVAPTDYSDHLLYGDDMGALKRVPKARNLCKRDYLDHLTGDGEE